MQTLSDLRPGDTAHVHHLRGTGPVFQRLCEMGFVPGTRLRVVRFAPFGDPMQVQVGSHHLSLRRAEAAMVLVDFEPLAEPPAASRRDEVSAARA